ncbi:MAG: serine hydrolase domain-containing protein [Acidimicrobiales bacterium]
MNDHVIGRVDHGGDAGGIDHLYQAGKHSSCTNPSSQRHDHVASLRARDHYAPTRVDSLSALSNWPVGHASGVVVGGSSPRTTDATEAPLGPPSLLGTWGDMDREYRWASLTKLCTSLVVLVAIEEGTLSLEQQAGPQGATVRHLLAHASGLAPSGRSVLAAPGRRRIYSNSGFEVLGELVTERSGIPFGDYLREGLLEPLEMNRSRLPTEGSPASGMVGTATDLAALAGELLAPTLVSSQTLNTAVRVAFPGLSGVLPGFGHQPTCDWGLGFEIRDAKSPHWTGSRNSPETFGHFGQAGGFLWVDPSVNSACVVLTDTSFGPWAIDAWPKFSDDIVAELRP